MYSGSNGTFDDEYIRYVLDAYSNLIVRMCRSYVKNMHDAEDIAQDVFCELIRSRPVFRDESHEKAWLLRTAANKCKNHLKSGWVRKTIPLEDNLHESCSGCVDAELDDTNRIIRAAVDGLPEKYRTVIHLFYYSGLSISEIAAVQKTATGTVGTRLARGRELLKERLGEDIQ